MSLSPHRCFLCTMGHNKVQPVCRWAVVDDEGWVDPTDTDPGTPIEDFGMWFSTDHEISPEQAFEVFVRLIAAREEGENPDLTSILQAVETEKLAASSPRTARP